MQKMVMLTELQQKDEHHTTITKVGSRSQSMVHQMFSNSMEEQGISSTALDCVLVRNFKLYC